MSDMNDLIVAQKLDLYTSRKVDAKLDKLRPKYAVVKSIDTDNSMAEVSYVGEDSVVKVPFGVAAPTDIGQEVRIEGVPGDRYITSVRGVTAVEQGVTENAEQIEITKTDITDALLGTYEGEDSILNQLMGWAGSLGADVSFDALLAAFQGNYTGENPVLQAIQVITRPLRIIFDGAGLIPDWLLPGIPIGKLTDNSVNLITDGAFELPPAPGVADGSWYHSTTGGRGDTGAAAFDANGTDAEILSGVIPRASELTFTAYVRTEGAYAPGTGSTIVCTGYAYDGANNLVGSKALVSGRPNSAWMELSGEWEPPSNASTIVIGLKATSVLQSGTMFIDDVRLSRPQSIPQAWVQNLLGDLQGMFGWIETLVDSLLGGFGVPSIGDLFDKIIDLADEVADFFGLGQDTAGGLDNLLDGLLTNPMEWIGQIPQSLIAGLTSSLNNVNTFIQNVVNVIIQGIKKVPIVGGSIANLLEAITGLTNTVEYTESNVTIVQTQVTAVQEVFSVTSTKPLWSSLDPTADSSFPLSQIMQPVPHRHGYDVFTGFGIRTGADSKYTGFLDIPVTGNKGTGAAIRVGESGVKDQVNFMAKKTDNLAIALYVHVMKLNDDGSMTRVSVSEDVAGDLTATYSWITARLQDQIIVEPGDVLVALFSGMNGLVQYSNAIANIMGIQMLAPSTASGFRPRKIGFEVPISSTTVTYDEVYTVIGVDIDTPAADSGYSSNVTYVELGRDVGQSAKRSFFDDFNRSSLGNNWLLGRYDSFSGTSGGNNLSLSGNQVKNPSSQSLSQRAWGVYTVPLSTDDIVCEADITGNDNRAAGIMICANSRQYNYLELNVTESQIQLRTVDSSSARYYTTRFTVSSGGGVGRWRLAYKSSTKTFTVHKNGVQVGQWVDSDNYIKHGRGERFCGMFIEHGSFNSGPQIDNWHAYDLVEA